MSLAKTLMKVVIGVAIVKGVSSLTTGGTDAAKPAPGRNTAPGRGTRVTITLPRPQPATVEGMPT